MDGKIYEFIVISVSSVLVLIRPYCLHNFRYFRHFKALLLILERECFKINLVMLILLIWSDTKVNMSMTFVLA